MVRRGSDPGEIKKGPIDAVVLDPVSVPSHHGPDLTDGNASYFNHYDGDDSAHNHDAHACSPDYYQKTCEP